MILFFFICGGFLFVIITSFISRNEWVNDLGLKLKNLIDPYYTKEIGTGSHKPASRSNKNLAEKSKTTAANSNSNEPTIVAATTSGGGAIPKHNKNLPQDSGNSMQSINADDDAITVEVQDLQFTDLNVRDLIIVPVQDVD